MGRFPAEFLAAQVRCFSGETFGDLRQGNAGIDYISVFLQPQVVISGFARPSFFRRPGVDEDVVVCQDAVLLEPRGLEELFIDWYLPTFPLWLVHLSKRSGSLRRYAL